jgi:hypothetical protein
MQIVQQGKGHVVEHCCLFGATAGNICVRDRNWTLNRHDCGQQSSNALLGDWMPIMTRRWLS